MKRKPSELVLAAASLVCILVLAACNCAPTLRYITISPASTLIDACTTQQYTATGYYSNGSVTPNLSVAWGSSAPTVATINSTTGVATAVAFGTTTITASTLGISATSATLNVQQLKALVVTPLNPTIAAAATEQFKASGVYINPNGSLQTTPTDVTSISTWTSGTPAVATIATTGLATAVANGTSVITASVDCLTANTTLTVGPATPVPVSLVITATPSTIAAGGISYLAVQEKWSDNSLHNPSGTVAWTSSAAGTAGVVSAIAPSPTYDGIAAGVAAGPATITATEGTLTGTVALMVTQGTTKYAIVSNNGSGYIQGYSVNTATSPFLTSLGTSSNVNLPGPYQSFLHPSGNFMYELYSSSLVALFDIDATAGTITQNMHPTTTGTDPKGGTGATTNYATVDPYGRFMYITEHSTVDNIWAYTISPVDGSVQDVPGSPFGGAAFNLSNPTYVTVDRTGQYLFAVNQNSGMVSAYSINQTTGALTVFATQPTIATGSSPQYAALDPSGTHLYVANSGAGSVSAYSITAGVLASIGNTTVSGATLVSNVEVSPGDQYLLVLDKGNGTTIKGQVYGYALTGGVPATTPVTGTPVATGLGPIDIAIDPTGTLAAVDNAADGPPGSLSIFTYASGSFTVQPTVPAGTTPQWVTFYNVP